MVVRYTVERFLARLAASKHRNRFVLKGAMLYVLWDLEDKRTTMDLDLLGLGNPDPEHLTNILAQVGESKVEEDGLFFDTQRITVAPIREESIYDGVRSVIQVRLGSMPIRLQVDVGFGDVIVPAPKPSLFPSLLTESGPEIQAYSPETVIAEKFNAMVVLGMANSRMKDYFDIWMLSQHFTMQGAVLQMAIQKTFSKRQTELPQAVPIGLSQEFVNNELKQRQWKGFIKRLRRDSEAPDISEIVTMIKAFLMPVVSSVFQSDFTPGVWYPSDGWQDSKNSPQAPGC